MTPLQGILEKLKKTSNRMGAKLARPLPAPDIIHQRAR